MIKGNDGFWKGNSHNIYIRNCFELKGIFELHLFNWLDNCSSHKWPTREACCLDFLQYKSALKKLANARSRWH